MLRPGREAGARVGHGSCLCHSVEMLQDAKPPPPLSALHCVVRPWPRSRERGVTLFAPCVVQGRVFLLVRHRSQFCPEGCSVCVQRGGIFFDVYQHSGTAQEPGQLSEEDQQAVVMQRARSRQSALMLTIRSGPGVIMNVPCPTVPSLPIRT